STVTRTRPSSESAWTPAGRAAVACSARACASSNCFAIWSRIVSRSTFSMAPNLNDLTGPLRWEELPIYGVDHQRPSCVRFHRLAQVNDDDEPGPATQPGQVHGDQVGSDQVRRPVAYVLGG